jgi:hypothetical protein
MVKEIKWLNLLYLDIKDNLRFFKTRKITPGIYGLLGIKTNSFFIFVRELKKKLSFKVFF